MNPSWTRPWAKLDQALRATDLLLQAGGFAAIVLDLGDTAPEQANRIPAATWFRYRQAAERTRCCLIVVGKRPYAQSAAAVVLECEPARAAAAGGCEHVAQCCADFRLPCGAAESDLRRWRLGQENRGHSRSWGGKPPVATWQASAAWDAERARA